MLNVAEAYFLFNSQNYTKKELEVIYGDKEEVNPNICSDIVDKAIEIDDWRIVEHVLDKYDMNGRIRDKVNCG